MLKDVDADKKAPSNKLAHFFKGLFGKKDKKIDILAEPVGTKTRITKAVPTRDIISQEGDKSLNILDDDISRIKNLDLGEDTELELKPYDEASSKEEKNLESSAPDSKIDSKIDSKQESKLKSKDGLAVQASTPKEDTTQKTLAKDKKPSKEPSVKTIPLEDISPKAIKVEDYPNEQSLNLNLSNLKTIKDSLLEAEAKARELDNTRETSLHEDTKKTQDFAHQTLLVDELSSPKFKLYEIKNLDEQKDTTSNKEETNKKEAITSVEKTSVDEAKKENSSEDMPLDGDLKKNTKSLENLAKPSKDEVLSPSLNNASDSSLNHTSTKQDTPNLNSLKKPPQNPKHIAKKKSNKGLLKLSIVVIVIIIILVVFYRILASGIHIKDMNIAGIEVQNAFLKLENKFVLTIDKVDVTDSKAKQENTKTIEENVNDAINYIQKSIFIFSYFKFLEIKDISINHKYTGSVRFDGKSYILKTPLVNASFSIVSEGKDLVLNVKQFLIKGFDAILGGDLIYSVPKKELAFNIKANFTRKEALTFTGISTTKKLRLSTQSTNLASLDMFKKYFDLIEDKHLKDTLEEWLYTNIAYSSLKIEDLRLDVRLDPKDIAEDFLHKTHAKISFKDLNVTLASGLDPISVPNAYLTYKDKGLYIKTPKANFNEAILDGSSVDIVNMPHPDIHINIIAQNATLDKSLEAILNHYDVHMPIRQLDIPTKAILETFSQVKQTSTALNDKSSDTSLNTQESAQESSQEDLQAKPQEDMQKEDTQTSTGLDEAQATNDTSTQEEDVATNAHSTDTSKEDATNSNMLDNTMKLSLAMNLIYNPETKKDEFNTKGIITGKNMQLALYDYPLSAKNLQVALDINHTQEMLYITGDDVTYKDLVNGNMQASLDLKSEVLKANTLIKKAKIATSDLDKFTPLKEVDSTKLYETPKAKEAPSLEVNSPISFSDEVGFNPYGFKVIKTAFTPDETKNLDADISRPNELDTKDKNLYFELHSDIQASKPSPIKDTIPPIDGTSSKSSVPKEETINTFSEDKDTKATSNELEVPSTPLAPLTPSAPIIIAPITPLESTSNTSAKPSKEPTKESIQNASSTPKDTNQDANKTLEPNKDIKPNINSANSQDSKDLKDAQSASKALLTSPSDTNIQDNTIQNPQATKDLQDAQSTKDVIITKPTKSQVWDKLKVQKQETRPFKKLSPKEIANLAKKEVEKEKELNLDQDLLDIKDKKLAIEIDFKHHLVLKIPTLDLNLSIDELPDTSLKDASQTSIDPNTKDAKDITTTDPTSTPQPSTPLHRILHVQASNLQKLVDISPLLVYYGLKDGDAVLAYPLDDNKTHDFSFKGKLTKLDYPIYSQDDKKLTEISLSGESKNGFLNITSDKNIVYKSKDSLSMLKSGGYTIDMDAALDSKIPFLAELFKDTNSLPVSKEEVEQNAKLEQAKATLRKQLGLHAMDFNIVLNNMTFLFKGYKIPLEDVNARIKSHKTIVDGSYGNGIFNMTMVDGVMFFDAKNFSGDFVNRVLKSNGESKDIVSGGLFNLKAFMRGGNISATISMNNTAFTDFKVVQNIFALIDTVPSLIVFKNPHLGADGYKVDRGIIKLAMNKDYLGLENIYLVGSTMDINGEGIIDLASKETSITLNISTIKNVSSLLSRIPVVGYIILGREGKISTNLILTGKYDNPKVNISLAEDVIKAPFNILKRVFTPIDFLIDSIIDNNK
ncbi:hypothetical protein BKH43_04430 [Helicobacter sp. 13S00401-1]|nr:hypothetical protein BKH43_04430 [Helicobacter sp. 13S00401-1]